MLYISSMIFISKLHLKLTLFLLTSSLFANDLTHLGTDKIYFQTGESIKVYLARSAKEQELGLSYVSPFKLGEKEGMLFLYENLAPRRFWMPNTNFNLDLFFFDKEKRITNIVRNLKCSKESPDKIDETDWIPAQFVLEMKSSSPFAKKLKIGDSFEFLSTTSSQKEP